MSEWWATNLLMAIIVGLFVSWWRNTGRAFFGKRLSKLSDVQYFIHSSPSYGRFASDREQSISEEKAYGRWKRKDDAGETFVLFIVAALWTSEESKPFRDSLPIELLALVALVGSVRWYFWMRNTPPAPRVEDEAE